MKKYIYILLFISISANCQEKALLKADQKFQKEQYIEAIKIYEQLAKKGVASIEIYQRLGDSYYFNANYEKAFVWYQKLYELEKFLMHFISFGNLMTIYISLNSLSIYLINKLIHELWQQIYLNNTL